MPRFSRQQLAGRLGKIALVGMLVFLRVVCLNSDAYSRLSWSSALLTDEGFYIHNARNVVLFGQERTDDFNNALIMPLLHVVQLAVFKLAGVGAIQARSISIVLSLLTLWAFFAALRRAFGSRVAWTGLVLLGLDPVFVLYNRMALMDTPACLPLCAAFYSWIRAQEENKEENKEDKVTTSRFLWLPLCGACLGLAYCVRGLAAVMAPVPLLLLYLQALGRRRDNAAMQGSVSRQMTAEAAAYLAGLGFVLAAYLLLWYAPHHRELARVNAYYLHRQLLPDTLHHLWQNIQHAFFGDDRGVAPYLFRHAPITFALCLLWLVTQEEEKKKEERREGGERAFDSSFLNPYSSFLLCWLLLNWTMLAVISYAPDRYYVLFYPAMCGLAALAVNDIHALGARLWRSRLKRALLGGFLAYHLGEAFWHHASRITNIWLAAFVAVVLVTLALLPPNMSQWLEQLAVKYKINFKSSHKLLPAALLFAWALVALAWTSDWLLHLSYTQRDADRWLAAHLPAGSVLIGDVAPGLCLNNGFRVVNVIPDLCNDRRPVERFAPAPRYILILDDRFKEPWWRANYPELVAPDNRVHAFARIVRLPVGVYAGSRP